MFLFLIFKIIRRAFFAIVVAGVVIAAIALSGCGKFTPVENVTVTLPDSGTEQETPDTEEPVTSEYLNTKVSVTDYSLSSGSAVTSVFTFSGEINNLRIRFDFSTEYEPVTGPIDRAYLNIGTTAGSTFKVGTTYTISIQNNEGYFWENNLGWYAIGIAAWGDFYTADIFEFTHGETKFTPAEDIRLLQVQLLPYPVTAAGTVDFYISIFID